MDRASLTLFVPSTAYAKSLCPWRLMSAVRLAEIYCKLFSAIAFSYISGLGTNGRLRTRICTHPCLRALSQRHAI